MKSSVVFAFLFDTTCPKQYVKTQHMIYVSRGSDVKRLALSEDGTHERNVEMKIKFGDENMRLRAKRENWGVDKKIFFLFDKNFSK